MSKAKATYTDGLPEELDAYLHSREFAREFMSRVLEQQLRINDASSRPAEHYMQKPDLSMALSDRVWGIELALTKVSVRDGRHFQGALTAMYAILVEAIKRFVLETDRIQIYCVIQTDIPVPGEKSTLFETREPQWVTGGRAAA